MKQFSTMLWIQSKIKIEKYYSNCNKNKTILFDIWCDFTFDLNIFFDKWFYLWVRIHNRLGKRGYNNSKFDRNVKAVWPKIILPMNWTQVLLNDSSLMKLIYHLNSIVWLHFLTNMLTYTYFLFCQ